MFKQWGKKLYAESVDGNNGGAGAPANVQAPDALFDNPGNAGGSPQAGATPSAGASGDSANASAGNIKIPENWKDALPDDLKSQPWLKNITTVETLAKSYQHAQKLIGADKIPVPNPKTATPEEWKNIYSKLGLSEKVEEYKLDLDKGVEIAPEFLKELTPVLHANGILPHQAKALVEWFDKADKKAFESEVETLKTKQMEEITNLKKEWGSQYSEEVAKAKAALVEFTTPEERETIRKLGFGNNTHLIKILAKAGNMLSEDKIKGEGGLGGGLPTPNQAKAEAASIMADKNSPYWKADHPQHKELKTKVTKLFEIAASI